MNWNEEIEKIMDKKKGLEKILLKALGQKIDFEAEAKETYAHSPFVAFSQESVITGTSLGILGHAIYNVDIKIVLFPSLRKNEKDGQDEIYQWSGMVSLVWQHPGGGRNGFDIGVVKYTRTTGWDFWKR